MCDFAALHGKIAHKEKERSRDASESGIPAALKNALDYAYPEWNHKPAAYVGYGAVGGARAIEQLRLINIELKMAPLRSGVHIQGSDFMAVWQQGKNLAEIDYLEAGATTLLDELVWWTNALKAAREPIVSVEV